MRSWRLCCLAGWLIGGLGWENELKRLHYRYHVVSSTASRPIASIIPQPHGANSIPEPHTYSPLQPRPHIDMHSLCIRVGFQPFLPQLSSNPALLHSSEGNPEIRIVTAIDPNHTRLDPPRNSVRLG